jgi:RNA polymerase sigma-70 factor (ECF subfamily)
VPVDGIGARAESALEETAPTPETLLDEERARELLYQLLSELDERFRVVFVMYEIEAMTMQEIAEVLEVPVGTVASRLRAAREDFGARLERYRARTRREVGQ